ncbi:MAG: contractile injection system tape measure protein [Candidatus Acidiferrum sp.]
MHDLRHRIRRQRWVVRTGSAPAAFRLRQRLRDDSQDRLLPAFQKAFDRAAGGEEVLRVPRLVLSLKVASEEVLMERLPELIEQELAEQLRNILQEQPSAGDKPAGSKASAAQENRLQVLLHYLRTGSVPWEVSVVSASALALRLSEVCRVYGRELQAIARSERAPAVFYFRWFQLVPAAEASDVVRSLADSIAQSWKLPLQEMLGRLLEPEQIYFTRQAQLQLAALLVSEVLPQRESLMAPDLRSIAGRALPLESQALDDFIAALPVSVLAWFQRRQLAGKPPRRPSIANSVAGVAAATQQSSLREEIAEPSSSPVNPNRVDIREETSDVDVQTTNSFTAEVSEQIMMNEGSSELPVTATDAGAFPDEEQLPEAESKEIQLSPSNSAATEDLPLMVTHAGLILLHPFLSHFLESTGTKQPADAGLSPFVLPRAAALLCLLATGEEEVYEYDLVFIKILLGLKPNEPLCVAAGWVTESDRHEVETLLHSAITHWAALKNTSVAGLRATFLNRQGLLREDESGWKLQVERAAFDVLLGQLPWSISVVKLPWMPWPIYTEW